jgi:hypothetical protein
MPLRDLEYLAAVAVQALVVVWVVVTKVRASGGSSKRRSATDGRAADPMGPVYALADDLSVPFEEVVAAAERVAEGLPAVEPEPVVVDRTPVIPASRPPRPPRPSGARLVENVGLPNNVIRTAGGATIDGERFVARSLDGKAVVELNVTRNEVVLLGGPHDGRRAVVLGRPGEVRLPDGSLYREVTDPGSGDPLGAYAHPFPGTADCRCDACEQDGHDEYVALRSLL